MTNFSDALASLDVAVEDHLCDAAIYTSAGGGDPSPARVIINHPRSIAGGGIGFSMDQSTIAVAVSAIPDLVEGDVFAVAGEAWRIAAAPTRPGDGRWWEAPIEPTEEL